MRSSVLAAVAAILLLSGRARAGPVSLDSYDKDLAYDDGYGFKSGTFENTPFVVLGSSVPSNAPPDFWMDKAQQVPRPPPPPGRHYEFMYCDRKFNNEQRQCGGTCNYLSGTVENGEITLFTPNTKCVVMPCDLVWQSCEMKNHQTSDKILCKPAKLTGGPLDNGMCLLKGGTHAIRVGH